MKILHVAYIYPPKLGVADGITTVAYNVTRELAKRGHEVAVFTSDMLDLHNNSSLQPSHSVVNGVDVYYLKSIFRSKTFTATPSLISLFSENTRKYDVIHIHDCRSFQGIVAYVFAKLKKVPYVYQPHGSFVSTLPESTGLKFARITIDSLIGRKIVMGASTVIAISQAEAFAYRDFGVPEERIKIVPNGIDTSKYFNLPCEGGFKEHFKIAKDKKVVLYLGRIHSTKGLSFLIRAYAYLTNQLNYVDSVLVIAGPDDGFLSNAKRLANKLGIMESVLFTGSLSEKEKIQAYVDSDVVVNVEPRNAFGLVIIEAAACQKPVIVSEGNAISEVVHAGRFGFSVKYGRVGELAELLDKMLSDDASMRSMGGLGRDFIFDNYGWDSVVDRLEKAYDEIAQQTKS